MDKSIINKRAQSVRNRTPTVLSDLGFIKMPGGVYVRAIGKHACQVGLQKFRSTPAFRIIYSFSPEDPTRSNRVELSDRYTYKGSPSGRKYNFNIRWGEDAVEKCLAEIHHFVEHIVVPWATKQAEKYDD